MSRELTIFDPGEYARFPIGDTQIEVHIDADGQLHLRALEGTLVIAPRMANEVTVRVRGHFEESS